MNKKKGFTLIELLVVIAIIGILGSIVYVSLVPIRLKSKDTAVKTQLSNMKVQAEIYFDMNNKYDGVCTTQASFRGFGDISGPGLLKATKDTTAISSTIGINQAGIYNYVTCNASVNGWAVEAPLSKSASGSPDMYCVDSKSLTAKEKSTNLTDSSDIDC